MENRAEEILDRGTRLLQPLFLKHRFTYSKLNAGNSSGGPFARGEFQRGTRKLVLHFRYSLGMVTYHLDSRSISHQDYMRSVMGIANASHYPGFSSDPLDGFLHLLADLKEH